MRCANCGHLSLGVICQICKDHLLSSPARTRVLDGDFKIYSFLTTPRLKIYSTQSTYFTALSFMARLQI